MAKLKTVNEVEALKGVFYSFFDMERENKDNKNDKVLISVQLAEYNINPFFRSEIDYSDQSACDVNSTIWGSAVNLGNKGINATAIFTKQL